MNNEKKLLRISGDLAEYRQISTASPEYKRGMKRRLRRMERRLRRKAEVEE